MFNGSPCLLRKGCLCRWLVAALFAFLATPVDGLRAQARLSAKLPRLASTVITDEQPSDNSTDTSNQEYEGSVAQSMENVVQETDTTGGLWMKTFGLRPNGHEDGQLIYKGFQQVGVLAVFFFVVFSFLRRHYPQIYANNVLRQEDGGFGTAPWVPSSSFFGWVSAGLFVTAEEAEQTSGLDAALCVGFNAFAMKAFAFIGIPILALFGTGLSQPMPRPSWLDPSLTPWLHALVVWYVVLVTEFLVFREMASFLPRRFQWLHNLQVPRASTLLVENIPEKYCSNSLLKEYFAGLFPFMPKDQVVEVAWVCKHTDKLEELVKQRDAAKGRVERNIALTGIIDGPTSWELSRARTTLKEYISSRHDIATENLRLLQEKVKLERSRILENEQMSLRREIPLISGNETTRLADVAREVEARSGFVTFTSRVYAMLVIDMRVHVDSDEFTMSIPPPLDDVLWRDLKVGPTKKMCLHIAGYFLIFLCFVFVRAFFFFSMYIDRFCSEQFCRHFSGLVHVLPLQIYLSFLPSILMLIFQYFFSLKALAWAQKFLQTTYFCFMFLLILIRTSLGSYLGDRTIYHLVFSEGSKLFSPVEMLRLIATNLPNFTTWYISFLLVRTTTHLLQLTRYINIGKYLFYRILYSERRSVELAEPEDQDFYGFGSRSARFAMDFVIGIVFCSVSPLITVVAFCDFFIARIIYGYLLVFAETRKPDTGGTFFVSMLNHVQIGLAMYVLLMWGVLAFWTETHLTKGPAVVVGFSLIYLAFAHRRLRSKFTWKSLPFDEVVTRDSVVDSCTTTMKKRLKNGAEVPMYYRQPELYDADED